jgi:hypothetical protein
VHLRQEAPADGGDRDFCFLLSQFQLSSQLARARVAEVLPLERIPLHRLFDCLSGVFLGLTRPGLFAKMANVGSATFNNFSKYEGYKENSMC